MQGELLSFCTYPKETPHEHRKAPMHCSPSLMTASTSVGSLSIQLLAGLPFDSER